MNRVCSIFRNCSNCFHAWNLKRWFASIEPRDMPAASPVGATSWPAVLPTRRSPVLARNLWRFGFLRKQAVTPGNSSGAQAVYPGLRQQAPALGVVSQRVSKSLSTLPARTGGALSASFSQSPADPRQHADRSVRFDLRLGHLAPHQRDRQTPSGARPSRLPAAVRGRHRRHRPRIEGG